MLEINLYLGTFKFQLLFIGNIDCFDCYWLKNHPKFREQFVKTWHSQNFDNFTRFCFGELSSLLKRRLQHTTMKGTCKLWQIQYVRWIGKIVLNKFMRTSTTFVQHRVLRSRTLWIVFHNAFKLTKKWNLIRKYFFRMCIFHRYLKRIFQNMLKSQISGNVLNETNTASRQTHKQTKQK